jgi:hypothetical protein
VGQTPPHHPGAGERPELTSRQRKPGVLRPRLQRHRRPKTGLPGGAWRGAAVTRSGGAAFWILGGLDSRRRWILLASYVIACGRGRWESPGGGLRDVKATAKHAKPDAHRRVSRSAGTQQRHGPPPVPPPQQVAADPLTGPVAVTEQAVFGDQMRRPIVWCEIDSCISRHEDPAALGEADIRTRAIGAGWRHDAVGRLACPDCLQRSPQVWAAFPVVPCPREPAGDRRSPASHTRPRALPAAWQSVTAWYRNVKPGGGGRARWPELLTALASGINGWNAPHSDPVTTRHGRAMRRARRPGAGQPASSPVQHSGDDNRRHHRGLSGS